MERWAECTGCDDGNYGLSGNKGLAFLVNAESKLDQRPWGIRQLQDMWALKVQLILTGLVSLLQKVKCLKRLVHVVGAAATKKPHRTLTTA